MKLSAIKCKNIVKPGTHGDGQGLYLSVSKTGSKSWILRASVGGKRKEMGLGAFPAVSLLKAREKAMAARVVIAGGGDPLAEKRKAAIPTFREAAIKVHAINLPRWRSGKHVDSWLLILERHAHPILGDMPVNEIGREHVLKALVPIWTTTPETARRVRQRIRTVLKWAQAHGYTVVNMAGEVIDGALPVMPRIANGHHQALAYAEVADAMKKIRDTSSPMASRLCLEFLILTATRSGEARGATWQEIDAENRLWTIPGHRMKAGAEHRVPLSDAALAVLERAREISDGSGFIFPSPLRTGHALASNTFAKVLLRLGLSGKTTTHGLRSTFRDWASEKTATSWTVMELALAHSAGSTVERAYQPVEKGAIDRISLDGET